MRVYITNNKESYVNFYAELVAIDKKTKLATVKREYDNIKVSVWLHQVLDVDSMKPLTESVIDLFEKYRKLKKECK